MSTRTVRHSVPPNTPLSPEEQGHPATEVYYALAGGRRVATVSLTIDGQTWIAGLDESLSDAHVGSFATLDEAKSVVGGRLHLDPPVLTWVRLPKPITP